MSHRRRRVNRTENSYPHWCIVRYLANFQTIILARFASRTAAEAHVQFLSRAKPTESYDVIFDESLTIVYLNHSRKNVKYQDS